MPEHVSEAEIGAGRKSGEREWCGEQEVTDREWLAC